MKNLKKYNGLVIGIATLFLFQFFKWFPDTLEVLYTNGIYRLIRFVYSVTLTYLPFPILYLFILLLLFLLIRRLFIKKKAKFLPFTLNFLGWIVVAFYWLWGFNYARNDFSQRAGIEILEPDSTFLYTELLLVDSLAYQMRKTLSEQDTIAVDMEMNREDLQEEIRRSLEVVLLSFEEPTFAHPTIRMLRPKGSLLRLKTAGVYFPWVLEGHIDDGLHPLEKPYVMAHEMAHAYAVTNEGVCNFMGFMTCINSENPFIAYSGWLEYQGYLYRSLRRNFPELLKREDYQLPVFVQTDLKAIRQRLDKYPNIAPWLRDLFYNNYLKAQGISEGMKSYSQITRLAYSYKKKQGSYKVGVVPK